MGKKAVEIVGNHFTKSFSNRMAVQELLHIESCVLFRRYVRLYLFTNEPTRMGHIFEREFFGMVAALVFIHHFP